MIQLGYQQTLLTLQSRTTLLTQEMILNQVSLRAQTQETLLNLCLESKMEKRDPQDRVCCRSVITISLKILVLLEVIQTIGPNSFEALYVYMNMW